MKKRYHLHLLTLLLTLAISSQAVGQIYKGNRVLEYSNLLGRYYYWEPVRLQFGLGLAASRGDFCGSWHCNRFGINLNGGIYTMIQPGVRLGVELDYFGLGAKDKYPRSDTMLNFRGNNLALNGIFQINLLKDKTSYPGKIYLKPPVIMPYLKVGIGGLLYSPKIYYGNTQIKSVKPDVTPRHYPSLAVVFPVGFGLSYRYSERISIQGEITYHFTTTDALDGAEDLLPTRKFDGYGIASIKAQYSL